VCCTAQSCQFLIGCVEDSLQFSLLCFFQRLWMMVLQNPLCLLPSHFDRVPVSSPLSRLGGKFRELQLAQVLAGVPLAEKVPSWSYSLDHVQRQRLSARIQAGGVHAHQVA
jgi:hypothetical protein